MPEYDAQRIIAALQGQIAELSLKNAMLESLVQSAEESGNTTNQGDQSS